MSRCEHNRNSWHLLFWENLKLLISTYVTYHIRQKFDWISLSKDLLLFSIIKLLPTIIITVYMGIYHITSFLKSRQKTFRTKSWERLHKKKTPGWVWNVIQKISVSHFSEQSDDYTEVWKRPDKELVLVGKRSTEKTISDRCEDLDRWQTNRSRWI